MRHKLIVLTIIIIGILIASSDKSFSQKINNFCISEPSNISVMKDFSNGSHPKIAPFSGKRNYFLSKLKTSSISRPSLIWCVYNTYINELEFIDSTINNENKKMYFGFESDSLFVYDYEEDRFYKVIFPEKIVDYNIDNNRKKVLQKVLDLKLIENNLEFRINSNNDLAYYDVREAFTYIYLIKKEFVDPIIIKSEGTGKNESNIFWFSDTELIFIDGKFNSKYIEFTNWPCIYDISLNKTTKIEHNKVIWVDDYFDGYFLLNFNYKNKSRCKLSKINGKYVLKTIDEFNIKDIDNTGIVYYIFRVDNENYIFKAERKTGRLDLGGFYFSKLVPCIE